MTSIEARELDGDLTRKAGIPVARRSSRRDEFEVLGLLAGILLVLLVLALTLGVGPGYLT
ncbi:MAG: hypothetical protein ACLQBX_12535 [Candidatus Limnocylindrales bacterium]|jgi:hypothetical protein